MELNKTYPINIICRTEEGRSTFIAVETLNSESSVRYQDYYQKLLRFNNCGLWFENLEYPTVDVGTVVIAKINNNTNLWARGVISNISHNNRTSVYLLDYQKIMYTSCKEFDLRICPEKFLQLKLPTFLIDTKICLDDDDLKSDVEKLISKSQHGELHFCFVPRSLQNCIYSGELIVNNKTDNLFIPLKKLLKNFNTKKYFNDIPPMYGEQTFAFNPFKFTYLRDVFRENNLDIDAMNNSFKTLSCDEFSSTLDYLENYSLSDCSEKNIQNVTVPKQKAYSSFSSSMSVSNSSLQSTSSSENQNALDLVTTVADNRDETKSDVNTIDTISSDMDSVYMSSCIDSDTSSVNGVILKTKQDTIDRTTKMNDSEIKSFIQKIMKKRFGPLLNTHNSEDTEYKETNNSCIIEKKTHEINNKQTYGQDDNDIWWTDEES